MNMKKTVDINNYVSINTNKVFCLDTNVLYWYTYPRYGTVKSGVINQAQVYYDFVDKLVSDGNPLYTSVYNISELLNVIEKNEYDIYTTMHPEIPLTKKDYRRILTERESLKRIMKTTLANVKAICKVIDFEFSSKTMDLFVANLSDHRCDVFDYLILNHYVEINELNILSDDNDFATFEGINLYTANTKILEAL